MTERIASLSGLELDAELDQLASRVIVPYIVMAVVLAGLALMILKAHLPEINPEEDGTEGASTDSEKSSVFAFPHLMLGVLCIFVYVGVEVIAIDTIGLYGQFQGFDLKTAGNFSIYSLTALTIGYLLGVVLIPKYISQRTALVICASMGFVFGLAALATSGAVSIAFVVLLSFAHALMWPSIWPLALDGLGRFTKLGSALLVMGIVGGALLPLLYGAMADETNRQMAYWVTVPCYVYILYYATKGYRVGKRQRVAVAS